MLRLTTHFLSFQVFFLLKFGVVFESLSAEIKQFALELAEAILASTPTEGLIDVLKLAFGKYIPKKPTYPPEDDPDMFDIVTEDDDGTTEARGEEGEEDLPTGSVSTLDLEQEAAEVADNQPGPSSSKSGVKRKLRSGKVAPSKRLMEERQPIDPPPRYDLKSKDVAIYYPTVAKASEHHIGVGDTLVSKRRKFGKTRIIWRYECLFAQNAEALGYELRDVDRECEFWTQQSSATVTHIRRFHLGIGLGCRYCDWRTYSGASWKQHMVKFHKSIPEARWYVDEQDEVLQGIKFEAEEVTEADKEEVMGAMGGE